MTWGGAVVVAAASASEFLDKNWVTCDGSVRSLYYGRCYVEFDDGNSGLVYMSTSANAGLSWGTRLQPADRSTGIGGQPLVPPDGTVVVPIADANVASILAFRSGKGGASRCNTVSVAPITAHTVAGTMRVVSMPSAAVDRAGRVYVVWQDCRFERGCDANDLVMSTSSDGVAWSAVARIPIDPVSSGVDHFVPGLAADAGTSGATAQLVLTFYYFPKAQRTLVEHARPATC